MEVSDNVLARQALKRTEQQREKRRAADRLRRQLMTDEQREKLCETRRKWWRERSDKQRERKRSVEKLRREQMTNDKRGQERNLKRERQQNPAPTERGKRRIKLQCLGRGVANQATVSESLDGVNRCQVEHDLSHNKDHDATSNGLVLQGRIRLTDVKREARMVKRVCSNHLRLEAREMKPVRLSHIKRKARAKTAK